MYIYDLIWTGRFQEAGKVVFSDVILTEPWRMRAMFVYDW